MGFSYNPLWKLLIDRGMNKQDLREAIGLSPSTIAKMSKGNYVAMEVLDKICNYLDCSLNDIVQHVLDQEE